MIQSFPKVYNTWGIGVVEMSQIRDFVQPRYLLHFRKAQDVSSHTVAPWITHAIGKQMRKFVSVWLVSVHFGPFVQCDSENQWEIIWLF